MDGSRIRSHWSAEVTAMIATYRQFETLIPASDRSGAAHTGEDGRYVEALIRTYLERYLPRELEVLTGFILRPAVITGRNGHERKEQQDRHSTQLDIIVYDSAHFPVFQRFDQNVIVPPEGVIGILSVKKHITSGLIKTECESLRIAASLCDCLDLENSSTRPPFLGIVAMKDESKRKDPVDSAFNEIRNAYQADQLPSFDELVGFVGALDSWSITKRRPDGKNARYSLLAHHGQDEHLGLHLILSGILSVYYDKSRAEPRRRPGITGFESGRREDKEILIPFNGNVACPIDPKDP